MTILAYYASYAITALAALVLLWMRDSTSSVIAGLMAAFLAVAAAIPALALWLQKNREGVIPSWLQGFGPLRELSQMIGKAPTRLVRNRRLIAELTAALSATLLFRGFTLWVPLIPGTISARRALKRRRSKGKAEAVVTPAQRRERGRADSVLPANKNEERVMYIGLGGLLILILVLWLLGVV